ncbi:SDR family NAD(P)-dependent oxidoreductase [Candidatus Entotheonella palauensis]|uniref:SDR family NAD(P)-dependent oxidoreductase n=1 Tax=Candidatus Entotheonella palauensis TaxID=93172 RepID=UPI000B7E625A|nr:SDR family oxidoreductase [Candidatus Entotheonella palauensis]
MTSSHGGSRPDGPVVVISGGSRGLGQALVSSCLEQGYRVATFSRSPTPFIESCQTQDPEGCRFWWAAADSTDPAALKEYAARVAQHYGRLDALINNAGVGLDGLLPMARPADIERTIDLNVKGTIFLTRACTRFMLRQQSGCIVNISSVNALRGHAGVAVYSASKSALDGLSRSLAVELGPKNIRVNTIAPGYFDSDMVAHLSEEQKHRIERRTPLRRLGTVSDIANLVLFLISPQAAFITGQTIAIDGGLTC